METETLAPQSQRGVFNCPQYTPLPSVPNSQADLPFSESGCEMNPTAFGVVGIPAALLVGRGEGEGVRAQLPLLPSSPPQSHPSKGSLPRGRPRPGRRRRGSGRCRGPPGPRRSRPTSRGTGTLHTDAVLPSNCSQTGSWVPSSGQGRLGQGRRWEGGAQGAPAE